MSSDGRSNRVVLKVLSGVQAGIEVPLSEGEYRLGSDADDDIQIIDVTLKPGHVRLRIGAQRIEVAGGSGPVSGRSGGAFPPGGDFQEVEPLEILTAGTTRFALGLASANWTSITEIGEGKDLPPVAAARPLPARDGGRPAPRWLASRLFGAVTGLAIVLATGLVLFYPEVRRAGEGTPARDELALVKDALGSRPFGRSLAVRQEVDGAIFVDGYVETAAERRALTALLDKTGAPVRARIRVRESIRASVADLIAVRGLPITFRLGADGRLTLEGTVLDEAKVNGFVALLKDDVLGVTDIDNRIRTAPKLLEQVTELGRTSKVAPYVIFRLDGELIEVSGLLPSEKIDNWIGFLQAYSDRFAAIIPLRSYVQLQDRAAPATAAPAETPVAGITLGKPADTARADVPLDVDRLRDGRFDLSDVFASPRPPIGSAEAETAQPGGTAGAPGVSGLTGGAVVAGSALPGTPSGLAGPGAAAAAGAGAERAVVTPTGQGAAPLSGEPGASATTAAAGGLPSAPLGPDGAATGPAPAQAVSGARAKPTATPAGGAASTSANGGLVAAPGTPIAGAAQPPAAANAGSVNAGPGALDPLSAFLQTGQATGGGTAGPDAQTVSVEPALDPLAVFIRSDEGAVNTAVPAPPVNVAGGAATVPPASDGAGRTQSEAVSGSSRAAGPASVAGSPVVPTVASASEPGAAGSSAPSPSSASTPAGAGTATASGTSAAPAAAGTVAGATVAAPVAAPSALTPIASTPNGVVVPTTSTVAAGASPGPASAVSTSPAATGGGEALQPAVAAPGGTTTLETAAPGIAGPAPAPALQASPTEPSGAASPAPTGAPSIAAGNASVAVAGGAPSDATGISVAAAAGGAPSATAGTSLPEAAGSGAPSATAETSLPAAAGSPPTISAARPAPITTSPAGDADRAGPFDVAGVAVSPSAANIAAAPSVDARTQPGGPASAPAQTPAAGGRLMSDAIVLPGKPGDRLAASEGSTSVAIAATDPVAPPPSSQVNGATPTAATTAAPAGPSAPAPTSTVGGAVAADGATVVPRSEAATPAGTPVGAAPAGVNPATTNPLAPTATAAAPIAAIGGGAPASVSPNDPPLAASPSVSPNEPPLAASPSGADAGGGAPAAGALRAPQGQPAAAVPTGAPETRAATVAAAVPGAPAAAPEGPMSAPSGLPDAASPFAPVVSTEPTDRPAGDVTALTPIAATAGAPRADAFVVADASAPAQASPSQTARSGAPGSAPTTAVAAGQEPAPTANGVVAAADGTAVAGVGTPAIAAASASPSPGQTAPASTTQEPSTRPSRLFDLSPLAQLSNRLATVWTERTGRAAGGGAGTSRAEDLPGGDSLAAALATYQPLFARLSRPEEEAACWPGSAVAVKNLPYVLFWLDLLSLDPRISISSFDEATQAALLDAALNPERTRRCAASLPDETASRSVFLEEVDHNPRFVRLIVRGLPDYPLAVSGVSLAGGSRYLQSPDGEKYYEGSAPAIDSRISMIGELGAVIQRKDSLTTRVFDDDISWITF